MKVKDEYTLCDVYGEKRYSEITEIKFTYDNHEHKFDSCYICLQRSVRKTVFEKILAMIKVK